MKSIIHPGRFIGFTLVEVLVTVAAVSVIGGIGFVAYQGVREQAAARKLEQDVAVINNAIDSYRAAGGVLAGATNASSVIAKLKTSADSASASATLGFGGSFLDARVRPVFRDEVAAPPAVGASYVAGRFELKDGGEVVAFVFDEIAAVASAGTAETRTPALAQASGGKGWVWEYEEIPASAIVPAGEFQTGDPEQQDDDDPAGALQAPVITPPGAATTLDTFPKTVEITNPNPGEISRLYYSLTGTTYRLYSGPFPVNPGTTVSAVAISLDPSRFANSAVVSVTYLVDPFILAITVDAPTSMTYAQAGGYFLNNQPPRQTPLGVDVNLAVSLNAAYLRSDYFEIRYTLDGSEPGPASLTGRTFNGAFEFDAVPLDYTSAAWGADSLVIKAYALAKNGWFVSSPVVTSVVNIAQTPLPVDVVPLNPVGLPPLVRMTLPSPVPAPGGLQAAGPLPLFYYRTDGLAPLASEGSSSATGAVSGGSVTASISSPSSSSYTFAAQASIIVGYEKWFSSPLTTRSYNTVTTLNPDFVGANISGGDVNGSLTGSIFVAAPANWRTFNAGGTITRGNLYLPGLPEIEITGQGDAGTTVVAQGAFYSGTPPVSRSIIAGKEYSADGQLAEPQLDTRQIVDQSGVTYTNAYTVKITTSTFIEGKIYRNVDVPTNAVAVPNIGVTNRVTGTFDGEPPEILVAGVYSNNIRLNNTNAVLRLGVAGSSEVTQYVFSGGTWSKGRVEILGPVQIFYTTGFVNSGVAFGSTNTIDNLKIYVTAANGDVDIRSGGAIYGNLWVTNAASPANRNDVIVGNGGIFYGNITAQYLNVAPGGVVNVE